MWPRAPHRRRRRPPYRFVNSRRVLNCAEDDDGDDTFADIDFDAGADSELFSQVPAKGGKGQ